MRGAQLGAQPGAGTQAGTAQRAAGAASGCGVSPSGAGAGGTCAIAAAYEPNPQKHVTSGALIVTVSVISMGEIPGRLDELDTDQALLVVCRSGGRSQQVALYLSMNGFARVANMSGGMKALGLQV
mgnify:CR=1 FL=1